MSKARQSTRQRYRKPRADYQTGGRVRRFGGAGSFGPGTGEGPSQKEIEAMDKKAANKSNNTVNTKTNTTVTKPSVTTTQVSTQNNNEASSEIENNTEEGKAPDPSKSDVYVPPDNTTNTNNTSSQETSGTDETMEGSGDVTKDDQGNVRLTDTWDVDHDPEVVMDTTTGKPVKEFVEGAGEGLYFPEHDKVGDMVPVLTGNISKSQKDYSDLREGGRLASTLYNLARKFGTYKPLQYDVTIPAEKWASTEAVAPIQSFKGKEIQPSWVKGVNKVIGPSFKKYFY